MYLDWIRLQNFRTFREVEIDLVHSDRDFAGMKIPKPHLPNLNLLLGDNGAGKSAFLKGVALAALGPAVSVAGIFPYHLIRRQMPGSNHAPKRLQKPHGTGSEMQNEQVHATLSAHFQLHEQDEAPSGTRIVESEVDIQPKGDVEIMTWRGVEKLWSPIFEGRSDAFFFVGYGASRHVEPSERVDLASRRASLFIRAQRVQSLFQEAYPLIPLATWLPEMRKSNKGRFDQVESLINRLMGRGHYRFTGEIQNGEYLFSRSSLKVPFPALSDGYRAYLGWVGDLLYHVAMNCPSEKKLVDQKGIVMVDEIDLHLHPKWQMTVLPILARTLPNLQFILTSHSPLVVGSLEWMNIISMGAATRESSALRRIPTAVHGLDADQVLLTKFFGMDSTRAPGKVRQLNALTLRARGGDLNAAKELMEQMSTGLEKPS